MEVAIAINDSISAWIGSRDNLSFVLAMKPSAGNAIMAVPMSQLDLKMLAEDLLDGRVDYLLNIWLTNAEAHTVGKKLLAIANGEW